VRRDKSIGNIRRILDDVRNVDSTIFTRQSSLPR